MEEKSFNKEVQSLTTKLKGIRDRIKVKSHLASMDAQKSYERANLIIEKLENDLSHLKYMAKREQDHSKLTFHLGLMEARERWIELMEYLNPVLREGKSIRPGIDHAKIQAHLAMMDTKTAIEQRRYKIQNAFSQSKGKSFQELFKGFKKDIQQVENDLNQNEMKK